MKTKWHILVLLVLSGCSLFNDPENAQPWNPGGSLEVGQMTFELNGTNFTIWIFAENNGYTQGEIVLRGSGVGMENTLMLTFKPNPNTIADINPEMTGYWDLGVCIPINRYLLVEDGSNLLRTISRDSSIAGEFNLTFKHESDPLKIARFRHGAFKAKIDTSRFWYCVEG